MVFEQPPNSQAPRKAREKIMTTKQFKPLMIKVLSRDGVQQIKTYVQNRVVIGSILAVDLQVKDPSVSTIHALIEPVDETAVTITDLGSTKGTFIENNKIDVEKTIKLPTTIKVGEVELIVDWLVMGKDMDADVAASLSGTKDDVHTPALDLWESVEAKIVTPSPTVEPEEKAKPVAPKEEVRPDTPKEKVKPVTPKEEAKPTPSLERMSATPTKKLDTSWKKEMEKKRVGKDERLFSNAAYRSGQIVEVVTYWKETVLDVSHFSSLETDRVVTIGCSLDDDVEACVPEMFEKIPFLMVESGGNVTLSVVGGMKGLVRIKGKVQKIDSSVAMNIPLRRGDFGKLTLGTIDYFLSFVSAPPPPDLETLREEEPYFKKILNTVLVFSLIFLFGLKVVDLPKSTKDLEMMDDHLVTIYKPKVVRKKPPVVKKKIKLAKIKVKKIKPPKVKAKPKAKPKVKKKVKPRIVKKVRRFKKPRIKRVAKVPKRAKTKAKRPQTATVLMGEGKRGDGRHVGLKKGPGKGGGGRAGGGKGRFAGRRKGKGRANRYAGINLNKFGKGFGKVLNVEGVGAITTGLKSSAGGMGGMGSARRTTGLGGIGKGSSLSIGGPGGSIGGGIGGGSGFYGKGGGTGGSGRFGKSSKGEHRVTVTGLDPILKGNLERWEIEAVVNEHIAEIKHCYEKQLNRYPSLAGKIIAKWVINRKGRVDSVSLKSTLGNRKVERCVRNTILRWQFPKPRGGGSCDVGYPFTFSRV